MGVLSINTASFQDTDANGNGMKQLYGCLESLVTRVAIVGSHKPATTLRSFTRISDNTSKSSTSEKQVLTLVSS